MKLPEPPPRPENEPVLPLVNIVFLLMIFFMLTGAFAEPDLFKVEPPVSVSEKADESKDTVILMGADGRVAVGERRVSDQELQQLVTRKLAQNENAPIKFKADAGVVAERVIEVMELLRDAGVQKLSLLTLADK